jgi:hypothetical protein
VNKRHLVFLAGVLLAGCMKAPLATGTLRGHVSIGPLAPVVREGETEPTPAPEVYAARQIVIFKADGKREVARADIDAQGNYEVALQVGTYVVDINHTGIDFAENLPMEMVIAADEITVLNVDIDTGIR